MTCPKVSSCVSGSGFTLVEVMLVLAVISILLLFALPAYQTHVLQARRSVALTALEGMRLRQEQYFANFRRYAEDLYELGYPTRTAALNEWARPVLPQDPAGIYQLSIAEAEATTYVLEARATGAQLADHRCQILRISAEGMRESAPGSVGECW